MVRGVEWIIPSEPRPAFLIGRHEYRERGAAPTHDRAGRTRRNGDGPLAHAAGSYLGVGGHRFEPLHNVRPRSALVLMGITIAPVS